MRRAVLNALFAYCPSVPAKMLIFVVARKPSLSFSGLPLQIGPKAKKCRKWIINGKGISKRKVQQLRGRLIYGRYSRI